MPRALKEKKGERLLLLGNEAIARGALEAGLGFATTYPGTPASEIGDTLARSARETGIYFEYSVNEKVALELATAAALCGVRALVAMKHVGLNVAADAFMSTLYTGTRAGLVVVTADDPSMHSSQNEQDNRYYALLAGAPLLEPADPQEAYAMAKAAFPLSEELELPVLLRTTTRVSHSRAGVEVGPLPAPEDRKVKGRFHKDPFRFVIVPSVARPLHKLLLERLERAEARAEESPFNFVLGEGEELGIVTSGVSYSYVRDALEDLGVEGRVSVLKLGMSHPLPRKLVARFLGSVERALVVEELEPVLERSLRALAQELELKVKIYGKGTGGLSRLYEYDPDRVRSAIAEVLGLRDSEPEPVWTSPDRLPDRPPVLCPGCPHRASYYALKLALGAEFEKTIFATDIGCYTLGLLPPLAMADHLLCMGSSVGTAGGFSRASDQRVIAFIGDSTLFHAGIPAIVNAVHNRHKFLVVVLDNRTTAMTGLQPHPGLEFCATGPAPAVPIETLLQGCGVRHVHIVDPVDLQKATAVFEEALKESEEEVTAVISRHPCVLLSSGG
ncbi:MAG: indolepyruvate ferredoxin oxidoreductase subunit alpha [Candidatus Acetothermia bacterium]|jgi:indolepyruvate ferredoxin oxidoreductase alpha subunit|nr:indolepyruvate ferredoxin oxidoreductase subunit alpha [Candidatus Acetothermia bacterium]MDH7505210.1 indolepyruvate ferredoxin oxidoreductase subunit alpha [Candidatus Acetothermia bacterium]